jgi:hypothetical protein
MGQITLASKIYDTKDRIIIDRFDNNRWARVYSISPTNLIYGSNDVVQAINYAEQLILRGKFDASNIVVCAHGVSLEEALEAMRNEEGYK